MVTIYESNDLRVLYRPGDRRETWVAFGAYSARTPEADALFAHRGSSAIHILSKADDWYQTRDIPAALATCRRCLRGRVITVGASMGGFAAIAFASDLRAKLVIAGSPQIVLNSDLDGRWAGIWSSLPQTRPDARVGLFGRPDVHIISDPSHPCDAKHIALAPATARRLRLPLAGHEVFRALRDFGRLTALVDAMADNDHVAISRIEADFGFEAPRRAWSAR